jgi:hypothetical protein
MGDDNKMDHKEREYEGVDGFMWLTIGTSGGLL